jgi:hypothetical protein
VAGSFYPAEPERLREAIDGYLARARPAALHGRLRALVVPHAGYIYSGPVAASGYVQLRTLSPRAARVVLLGPSHHVDHPGLALPEVSGLATPLGVVPVDGDAAAWAGRFPQVSQREAPHRREHSLEVQLPFLQRLLPEGFTVVPLAVGRASAGEVAEVVDFAWGLPDTLVLVSSDLSHDLPSAEARRVDAATARLILAEEPEALGPERACGCRPLAGLVLAARRRGFSIHLLDLRNSGDTAGDPERVVGYGAFAVVEPSREDRG